MDKICIVCGDPFQGNRKAKTCSHACRQKLSRTRHNKTVISLRKSDDLLQKIVTDEAKTATLSQKSILSRVLGPAMYADFVKFREGYSGDPGFELNHFIRSSVSDLGCTSCKKVWKVYKLCCFACLIETAKRYEK